MVMCFSQSLAESIQIKFTQQEKFVFLIRIWGDNTLPSYLNVRKTTRKPDRKNPESLRPHRLPGWLSSEPHDYVQKKRNNLPLCLLCRIEKTQYLLTEGQMIIMPANKPTASTHNNHLK
jgi:hypothetical protein